MSDWRNRVDRLWSAFDPDEGEAFVAAMTALADELPGDPVALFELAGAHDSTDRTESAVELYRAALEAGLPQPFARQATIQLASSLRVLGGFDESIALLTRELADRSDELDDAARAFLALALHDAGRHSEAVSTALDALVAHLPRYATSVTSYSRALRTRGSA